MLSVAFFIMTEIQEKNPGQDESLPEEKESCVLHVSNFEGPLDLLWNLIKKAKIDIMEVSLSQITEQYIGYLRLMEKMNVAVATDFIIMASELAYYKSKALLPTGEMEDEFFIPPLPPELVQKLLEYKKFQKAGSELRNMYDLNQDSYARTQSLPEFIDSKEWHTMSLYDLLNAFAGIAGRNEKKEEKTIKFDEVLVSDKIKMLIDLLKKTDKINFFDLFSEDSTRGEIIATFLAILELTKIRRIKIMQSGNYEDIAVFRTFDPEASGSDEFSVTSVNL